MAQRARGVLSPAFSPLSLPRIEPFRLPHFGRSASSREGHLEAMMDRKGKGPAEVEEDGCEHVRGCEDCKKESRELNAAGEHILAWSSAISFLADQARGASAEGRLEYLNAIAGLSFSIAAVVDFDIVGLTLASREEALVHPASRFQTPRMVREA